MRGSFVERSLKSLIAASQYAAGAEQMAAGNGALQRVDPRVKVAGLFGLVMLAAASRQLRVIGWLFGAAVLLALLSRIPIQKLATWIWLPVILFTGAIALPALFLTPGRTALSFGGFVITEQGVRAAGFLISRAETTATLSSLLVLTTPWPAVLRALRTFRCPVVVVVILGMTYRYIFVILQTAFEMLESRKSRTVGTMPPRERRRLAASSVGVLLGKSLQLSGDVHLAMQSRGFRGEIHLLEDFRARTSDWLWLTGFTSIAIAGIWFQL
jgi:cobalt/nickel transport system permease protein